MFLNKVRLQRISLVFVLLFSFLSSGAQAGSQEEAYLNAFEDNYAAWLVLLDRIDKKAVGKELSQDERQALRFQLEYIFEEVSSQSSNIRQSHLQVSALLEVLGNPSEQEDPNLQLLAQYLKFTSKEKKLNEHLKQVDFIKVRTANLLAQLNSDIKTARWNRLFFQNPLPVFPVTWQRSFSELNETLSSIFLGPLHWLNQGEWRQKIDKVAGFAASAFVVMLLVSIVINRMVLRRFFYTDEDNPSYKRRLFVAVGQTVGRSAIPSSVIVGGAVIILSLGLMNPDESNVLIGVATNLFFVFIAIISCQSFLAPPDDNWRIVRLSKSEAKRVNYVILLLVLVLGISGVFSTVGAQREFSSELDSILTFVFGGLLSVLLLLLFRIIRPTVSSSNSQDDKEQITYIFWARLRLLGGLVVACALCASALGYSYLAKYILVAIISTGVVLIIGFLLRALGQELVLSIAQIGVTRADKQENVDEDRTHRTLHFILSFCLDAILCLTGGVVLLSIWGVPPEELFSLSKVALNGFSIGAYRFSILDFGLAILAFVIILVLTRATQWVVADRILSQTSVDIGVRHSIKTGTGYAGLILGGMIAVSVLGIDLSNLALVAGALSVGIGFGLQTMVNNFISGLILLIERPIKVGDWVVVGDKEGHVKHINVRATEITTFQKATIIIPNSEILSGSVTNWTHKDIRGRIDVPVGVAYKSDMKRVKRVLIECAKTSPQCMAYPEPVVIFNGFGSSSLDLELRFFVRDVDKQVSIRSDVLFSINEALDREGISMPFPQQVIHMANTNAQSQTRMNSLMRNLRRRRFLGGL